MRKALAMAFLGLITCGSPAIAEDPATLSGRAAGAYRRIPHRYTPFRPEKSNINSADAQELSDFLSLVNAAVVARVEASEQLQRRSTTAEGIYEERIASIKAEMKRFQTRGRLGKVATITLGAIDDQTAFIKDWAKKPGGSLNTAHPKVAAASQKLHSAYDALLKLYPGQPQAIQDAFFDPFCALDFI